MISGGTATGGRVRLLLLCIIGFLMTGCLGTKRTSDKEQTTVLQEHSEVKNESAKETTITPEIRQNQGISLMTGDSLVNARIREALRNFRYDNQSGSNSTSVRFDEESMALLIGSIVGATMDTREVNNSSTVKERSFEQETDNYIKTKISQLPWWAYVLAGLYLLPKIIEAVKLILFPVTKLLRNGS